MVWLANAEDRSCCCWASPSGDLAAFATGRRLLAKHFLLTLFVQEFELLSF